MKPLHIRAKNALEAKYPRLHRWTIPKTNIKILGNKQKFFHYDLSLLTQKEQDEIIKEADKILKQQLRIFSHTIHFTNLNWNKDYINNTTWERKFWRTYTFSDDIKPVWELNRCQHFVTLAQAYILTKKQEYLNILTTHLESWKEQNTYKYSVNWTSTLEVALRNISLIWVYILMRETTIEKDILELITQHTAFIKENYTKNGNNHLIGELTGLLYASLTFPEFKIKEKPILKELQKQMQRQVTKEGTNWEESTNYHKFTTDLFLHVYLLAQLHNKELESTFSTRLEKMVECMAFYTKKNIIIEIGDSDDTKVINLSAKTTKNNNDTFTIATAIFKRGDFKDIITKKDQSLIWLLGKKGEESYQRVLSRKQQGIRIDKEIALIQYKTPEFLLTIKGGFQGEPEHTHTHEDALSITFTDNKQRLIEAGTYSYSSELREQLRSQESHNTILTTPQAKSKGNFGWTNAKKAKIIDVINTDEKFECTMVQEEKTRKITLLKNKALIIDDKVKGEFIQNFIHPTKQKWLTTAKKRTTTETIISKNYLEKERAYRTQLSGENEIITVIALGKDEVKKLCAELQEL